MSVYAMFNKSHKPLYISMSILLVGILLIKIFGVAI